MRTIWSVLLAVLCFPPAVREALAQAGAPTLPGQGDAPHPAETDKVIPEKQAPAINVPPPSSLLPPVRDGVIRPPPGIDPDMAVPPPRQGSDMMPVIPPPTTDQQGAPVTPK